MARKEETGEVPEPIPMKKIRLFRQAPPFAGFRPGRREEKVVAIPADQPTLGAEDVPDDTPLDDDWRAREE